MLAVTMEAFAIEDAPEPPVGVGIPAALAFLWLSFAACALTHRRPAAAVRLRRQVQPVPCAAQPGAPGAAIGPAGWILMALIFLSGLAAIIAADALRRAHLLGRRHVAPPRLQLDRSGARGHAAAAVRRA